MTKREPGPKRPASEPAPGGAGGTGLATVLRLAASST